GRVADTAPRREIAVTGGVGVGYDWPHALDWNAKFFRHHQRLRDAGAADVGIAVPDGGTAIAVERDSGTGIHAGVEPEPAGHATTLMGAERRRPVRMLLHGFEDLPQPDRAVLRSKRRMIAAGAGILQSQLERIHVQAPRDLV